MGNLSNLLIMMFCFSTVFVLAGVVINDINPSANVFYDCNSTIMSQYGQCSNNDLQDSYVDTSAQRVTTQLPSIDTTQSNLVSVVVQTISNVFNSIGTWISNALGLSYLQSALDVPRLVLYHVGVPPFFMWAIVGLFTAITAFFFIDWMKGAFA